VRKLAGIALLSLLLAGATARAADVDALRGKVDRGRAEAVGLAGQIRSARERLFAAEGEAAVASRREQRLSRLLRGGRERAAELGARVAATERRLRSEKRRLGRARSALAERLVAIYQSGAPSTAGVVLGSGDMEELAAGAEYLERIEDSGTELAERVEQVRDAVRLGLRRVAELKSRVDAYNERLTAARAEIASVRGEAEASAARAESLARERSAALETLKAKIGEWVSAVEEAEAASRAAAEEAVGRWLGGPYSIPAYIVMCESGGDYGALNPSSGAGGAYQILPSTWELYGGSGAPHEAPKAEQDRIAAEIWADSGGGAWVCA
jgi:septal ring factor EnvC (AmiA/AmiB activator)